MAQGITTDKIEQIYAAAMDAGALGGKISGAGGGGYMFFFADIDRKYDIMKAIEKNSAEVVKYNFTQEGLQTWRVT